MRVLIIGDSQAAGAPGRSTESLLESLGVSVRRVGLSGQGAYDWSRVHWPKYQNELAAFNPDDVLLIFGSNDAATMNLEAAMARFRDSGPRVWYSGPPMYRDPLRQSKGGDIRAMAKRVFGSRYLDAWPYTGSHVPRAADGVHFGPAGGRVWAEGIVASWGRAGRSGAVVLGAVAVVALGLWWAFRRE
jgi:hypothetical protein